MSETSDGQNQSGLTVTGTASAIDVNDHPVELPVSGGRGTRGIGRLLRSGMGERHVSVTIQAPAELVFGLYTDAERARDWLSGVRHVGTVGPTDQPGGRAVIVYRWPLKMMAEVLEVERPNRHVQRLKELLGLVTCVTTARFRQIDDGTELRLEMAYRVAGGPIGRYFDSLVGAEMVTTVRTDLARLKALAEEQASRQSN